MTSKRARLIVSETNSHAPPNRKTKITAVVTTRRRGIRCISTGEVSRSAAKPSTMPAATLSCRNLFVFSGTKPTIDRFTPIVVRNTWALTAEPRRDARRPMRARSRRTRSANSTTSAPDTISDPLNSAPEASWKVPSRLKCRCHHSGSEVVAIDARIPPLSVMHTTSARRMVVSLARMSRGAGTTKDRATATTAVMTGYSTPGRNGVSPSLRPPGPHVRRVNGKTGLSTTRSPA